MDIGHYTRGIPFGTALRHSYRNWRWRRQARSVFKDPDLLVTALRNKGSGSSVIETHDGLKIHFRQNRFDAFILKEMFLDREYLRRVGDLPDKPVIVDIGGYIGDFSIFAAHYLGAQVYVYEPVSENFEILLRNVSANALGDRVHAFQMAVSDQPSITLNVERKSAGEVHVSAHAYPEAEKRLIPATTLQGIVTSNGLDRIDLLKIDCEGGEYFIFRMMTPEFLAKVGTIVFEYHRVVPDWQEQVARMFDQLRSAGFRLIEDFMVVTAVRD